MKITKGFVASILLASLIAVFAMTSLAGTAPQKRSAKAKSVPTYQKPDPIRAAEPPASELRTPTINSVPNPDMKEYSRLRDAVNHGRPINPADKARYTQLQERFGQRNSFPDNLDNTGGPDGFGFRYVDNQGTDTATYSWIELRGDAAATWLAYPEFDHDDGILTVPIGFAFPFYGVDHDSVRICTNGNIQFSTSVTDWTNTCLPSNTIPGPAIFPYWDDLNEDYGGNGTTGDNTIAIRSFTDYTVIEFDSIGHCCVDGTSLKFEAILYTSGRIKLQYNHIVRGLDFLNTQTVGIQQNSTGASLQYVCDATGIQPLDGLAVLFYTSGTGSLSGHVVDDGAVAVPGALISIVGSTITATTDALGNYFIPILAAGTFDVIASKHGFTSDTATGVVIAIGDTTTQNFIIAGSGLLTFTSTDVPQTINDNSWAISTLNVTQTAAILDIDVRINITHTFDQDLWIGLISPDGDTVVLADRRGGAGDNYTNTIFDDEAATPIANGTPPYTGSFIPDRPLSTFDSQNMLGTWTLAVYDSAFGDVGTLNGWEIYIAPGATTGGAITGIVTRGDNAAAIPGITVTVPTTPPLTRITGPDGHFSFGIVDAGTYTLGFAGGIYTNRSLTGVVVTNGGTATANQTMFVSIAGTVTDQATTLPITGAIVSVQGTAATAVTDAAGHYEVGGFAPGTYTVDFSASLYNNATHAGTVVTDNATATVNAQLTPVVFQDYVNHDGPVPIADLDTSFSLINVAADFTLQAVAVEINSITHTFDGDLHIWLRSPDGADWELSNRNGGAGDNYINTLFVDGAATPIANGIPPFTGTFAPDQSLEPLVGTQSVGDWQLVVYDAQGGDIGTIDEWTLKLAGVPAPHGTLSGTVRTLTTNAVLAQASVTVVGAGINVLTDAQGVYTTPVPVGAYSVTFSHAGYCDSTMAGVAITEGNTTTRDLSMRNPEDSISVTSITANVLHGNTVCSAFAISNTGNCPLTYTITDTSAWINVTPDHGTIVPGHTDSICAFLGSATLTAGNHTSRIVVTHNAEGSPTIIPVSLTVNPVSADDNSSNLPTEFALHANTPNPFNPSTTIRYDLKSESLTRLAVFDLMGRKVAELVNERQPAGRYTVLFDGANLSSGMYFYRLDCGSFTQTSKMILMK
jgi:subtilisin-like proprotein convertase family protein